MKRAFLDANILFPTTLRDLFVELDRAGAIVTLWSEDVQREWVRSAYAKRKEARSNDPVLPEWTEQMLAKQNDLLDLMLPNAKVTGYEELADQILGLADLDDRHVVAAAIAGHADVLVSDDIRAGFGEVLPEGLVHMRADDFLIDLLSDASITAHVVTAIRRQRKDYKNPPLTAEGLLDRFSQNGLMNFAEALTGFVNYL